VRCLETVIHGTPEEAIQDPGCRGAGARALLLTVLITLACGCRDEPAGHERRLTPGRISERIRTHGHDALARVWDELDVKPSEGLFVGGSSRELSVRELTFHDARGRRYSVLEVKDETFDSDWQYLVFRQDSGWRFLGHVDLSSQKFADKPTLRVITRHHPRVLLRVHALGGSGTGFLEYDETWYSIDGDGLEMVVRFPTLGRTSHLSFQGEILDESPGGTTINVQYRITLHCEAEEAMTDASTRTIERRAVWTWNEEKGLYVLDPSKSTVDEEDIELGFKDYCAVDGSADGEPLIQVGEAAWAETGQRFLVLDGGGLPHAVEIPLWIELDLSGYEDRDKCTMHDESVFFQLGDGRIYIGQYNSWCGRDDACRILDPATLEFSGPPGGCISPDAVHMTLEPLTGEPSHATWLAVRHEAEGVSWVDFVTYSPASGPEKHLHVDLHHDGVVEARVVEDGLLLDSNFDLLAKHEGLTVSDPEGTPSRRYRWTRKDGLAVVGGTGLEPASAIR
jgi:hypothetical protein